MSDDSRPRTVLDAHAAPERAAPPSATTLARFEAKRSAYLERAERQVAVLTAKVDALVEDPPVEPSALELHRLEVAAIEENLARVRDALMDARRADLATWDAEQRRFETALLATESAVDAASTLAH